MTTPRIGDIVWYRDEERDLPAIVIANDHTDPDEALEPGELHLKVFGYVHDVRVYSVPEDKTKDAEVPEGTWRWPPK
jgi:hypothetical protein